MATPWLFGAISKNDADGASEEERREAKNSRVENMKPMLPDLTLTRERSVTCKR